MPNVVRDQRGQVLVFFALLLPVLLALGGIAVGVGNWFVHAKHLQTKVDAAALAGGSAWSFPCTSGSDKPILDAARLYAGPHTGYLGATYNTNPTDPKYNEQVGGVPYTDVQIRLNANGWFDDDAGIDPADFTTPSGAVCTAKTLDVKGTELNSFPLASLIPLFPDLKRKARVQIEQSAGSAGPGLLPLAVRVPKPTNVAAVFVNETPGANGQILSAVYMNDVCELAPGITTCITPTVPSGLDQWTTDNGSGGNVASVDMGGAPARVGVVIALSFRPKCPGTQPCFDISQATISQLCNQGSSAIAQCYYTTGTSTQTFQSGLQFIRGWSSNANPAPDLLSAWIEPAALPGTFCYQGYFSAPVSSDCTVTLRANADPGFGGAGNTEIRYKLVSGNDTWQDDDGAPGGCDDDFNAQCVMTGGAASVQLQSQYARHAFGFAIYRWNIPPAVVAANNLPGGCANNQPTPQCAWYFPDRLGGDQGTAEPDGNPGANAIFTYPAQRAFMGNLARSGPVKYLHLKNVDCSDGDSVLAGGSVTGEAASVQAGGQRCFRLEMGLQGALARGQDEYPIQINVGNTSQSAVVDCDPDKSNLKQEIEEGCGTPDGSPAYAAHDFAVADGSGTPYCPDLSSANQFFSLPKPAPYNNWEPFTCILTQTSSTPNQVVQGFNQRIFGVQSNPSCPNPENSLFVKGRNYWHDLNNSFVGDPDDPDGAGPLDGPLAPQEDFYTFARPSRNEPTETPPGPGLPHTNRLRPDDPRFVLLFISPYNSFTGSGNENFPITAVGGFYITGYGQILGNGTLINEDPCADGAGAAVGAGNSPPPDLDTSESGAVAWGHFVIAMNLSAPGGGTGDPCPDSVPTSCVPVLVE